MKVKAFIVLLTFSTSAYAVWFSDWSENVYRVTKQKYRNIAKESIEDSCSIKIRDYTKLLKDNPESHYYKWKKENWIKRCKKENGYTK